MKKLLTCTAALVLLLGAQTSFAGHNDHGNRGYSYDRHDRQDNGRSWGRRDRSDHHDRDNVSVSLSFGNIWGGSSYSDWRHRDYRRATSGSGLGYTTTWGAPAWGYNSRPVIVQRNTYINEAPRARVVTRPGRNSTSLFRDIDGNCFERVIDSRGDETRTQLPASECNF